MSATNQPNQKKYGIEEIYLCQRLTRAIYLKKFGEEAPAYDSSRRIKRWLIPPTPGKAPDLSKRTVKVWDDTKKAIVPLEMTEIEAASVNLPGTLSYPKYVNPEASVAVMNGGSLSQNVNGAMLVLPTYANAIVSEIKNDLGIELSVVKVPDPWPFAIVWGTETRRHLNLVTESGVSWDASQLVRSRFSNGIGAPGKWVKAGDGITFVADIPPNGEMDLRPEVPMAVRDLLPNEKLEIQFMGIPVIVRTDIDIPPDQQTGSGLTTEEKEMLKGTYANSIKILAAVEVK